MNRSLPTALFLCAFLTTAQAQRFEFGATRAQFRVKSTELGSIAVDNRRDDDTSLTASQAWGGRFTWNSPGYYGHELTYLQASGTLVAKTRQTVSRETIENTFTDRVKIQTGAYNFLVYFMPRGEKWRPYMTGGAHLIEYAEPRFEEWTRGKSRHYGFNYGFGLKLIPSKHFLIRIDWRHYLSGKPYDLEFQDFGSIGGRLSPKEASVGVSFGF
jgi:hypothetical protein